MKFKNQEIGIPTLEMVEECCKFMGVAVPATDVYNYWKKKNFLTKQKRQVKTVEAMCSCMNSIYLERMRRGLDPSDPFYRDINKDAKALAKAERWITKNFDTFCDNMRFIMERDPQRYTELCDKFRTRLETKSV